MRLLAAALSFFVLSAPSFAQDVLHDGTSWMEADKVVLQGLDKVSARIFTAEVFVNQKVNFGSLEVYIRSAYKAPPEDTPEVICFLEIFDNKPGQEREMVFSGWMFASNPALSSLEHAVYDVWVKDALVPEDSELTDEQLGDLATSSPDPLKI